MSFFRSLWRGYLHLLETRPLTTKCTTSGLIMVAGDAIQQGIEYRTKIKEHEAKYGCANSILSSTATAHSEAGRSIPIPPASLSLSLSHPTFPSFRSSYDVPRSIRSGLFGAFAVGPIFHVWFRALDRMIPGSGFAPVMKKMLIDQGFMAPVFTVFYFATMGLMEQKTPAQIRDKIEHATIPTLIANYCIFPFSQAVNFAFVPERLRVLVLNAGGLVYNVYLSRYNAESTETKPEVKKTIEA